MSQTSLASRWSALASVVLAGVALAPAAHADPVVAGPPVPNELAVLTVGGALATPGSYTSDQVSLQRLATSDGAYKGRIVFPTSGTTRSRSRLCRRTRHSPIAVCAARSMVAT